MFLKEFENFRADNHNIDNGENNYHYVLFGDNYEIYG